MVRSLANLSTGGEGHAGRLRAGARDRHPRARGGGRRRGAAAQQHPRGLHGLDLSWI